MKPITQYQTADGEIHATVEAAERYERVMAACEQALAPLGPRPDDANFRNGDGYVQHTADIVREVRLRLIAVLDETTQSNFGQQDPMELNPRGYAGRVASAGPKPVAAAWERLQCIDAHYREWGEPELAYTADHGQT